MRWLITLTMLPVIMWMTGASPVSAEEPDEGQRGVSDADPALLLNEIQLEWAKRIIPKFEDLQPLSPEATHALGSPVLPKHQKREPWYVTDVQVEQAKPGIAHGVIIWLYPGILRKGPSHYPRSKHVLLGLIALAKDNEVIAVGKKLITRESDQVMSFISPISLPSLTLWGVEEVTRTKGEITRNHVYFRKRNKHLLHAGTVPVLSSNLGFCGTFERAVKKRRGLGGKERCKSIWHYEASISPTKNGLKVQENFTIAKARKYKPRTKTKTIRYEWRKGRMKANRSSLRSKVPPS